MPDGRLPRYKRAESPPAMQLTERDLQILRLVVDFRYATGEQVGRLLFKPGSHSLCKRRLSLLFHNGYLDRRFLPLRQAFGAARAYYILDASGRDVLRHTFELDAKELDWRPKDGRREPLYMEHTLRINDLRTAFMLATDASRLAWLDERELKRRARTHRVEDPLHPGELITIVPDGHATVDGRSSFALELDRGTVEEVPFKRKVRAYGQWKVSGQYAKDLGATRLRVLFVVADARRDPRRLERIKSWTEAARGGSLFWFASLEDVQRCNLLIDPVWRIAGRSGAQALIRNVS